MSLSEHYSSGQPALSFELFPPKTPAGEKALFEHVEQLLAFAPSFFTCTYGAGGSTRDKTLEIVQRVKTQFSMPVASHLTCVGSTVEQLHDYLRQAQECGVDYIVALRGDPPKGEETFRAADGGLSYANELVELIRQDFPGFGIAVAGYPETHQEAVSSDADLNNLKRKVEAGADIVVTQLFYDNEDFFRFRERYDQAGIQAPLVPGLLPVTNLAQIQRITSLCGARLPADFVAALERDSATEAQFEVGVEFATRQTQELVEAGVPGVHFYVLNKSQATSAVLRAAGWK